MSSDDKRYIDVGSEGIWYSILSTAEVRLVLMKKSINLGWIFFIQENATLKIPTKQQDSSISSEML